MIKFIIVVLIIVVVLFIGYEVVMMFIKENAKKKCIYKYVSLGYEVEDSKCKECDFFATKDGVLHYVKIIQISRKAEICVNSRNYFQINKGVVSSRKKGNKLENVYDLINLPNKKGVQKEYIIYPRAVRLLHVINECEMEFITPDKPVFGTYFINYEELGEKVNGKE